MRRPPGPRPGHAGDLRGRRAEQGVTGGAVTNLAGTQSVVLSGRLSLTSHRWLADHAVAGTVLLPGTAFVE
ncbi:hypothetical protein, partial [Streptomyces sp. AK04-3B]|uniref:hypothetical protein n=1 Tax=Streptomyces sp. AK04-3B TaxID=3028650 RepID=UPI0039F4C24E